MYRDDLIREKMASKKLRDHDIAKTTGITRSHICLIRNGKIRNPQIETLKAIAGAIGLTLNDLLTEKETA